MDLIITLLKKLATTLSPTEFLMVLVVLVLSVFFIVRFISSRVKIKGGLLGLLTGGESKSEDALPKELIQIKELVAIEFLALKQSIESAMVSVSDMREGLRENEQLLRKQMSDMLVFKRDSSVNANHLNEELNDIKHQMKMHDVQNADASLAIRELVSKGNDIANRIYSMQEKMDEVAKLTSAEFRAFHKDLSKEVNELSRDISILNNTIQIQSSSIQNITLR